MASFALFSDSACNLSNADAARRDVSIVTLTYSLGDESFPCYDEETPFDAAVFYARLRRGETPRTSLVNSEAFVEAFEPALRAGRDVLYVGLSSGVSGTYQSAVLAAEELNARYEAQVYTADTLAAGLGEGILVLRAATLRDEGRSAQEAAAWVEQNRLHMCQYLAVDDLDILRRGGRLPAMTAALGTMIGLKPVLYASTEGKIGVKQKVRGAARVLRELLSLYDKKALTKGEGLVGIAHGDDIGKAEQLRCALAEKYPALTFLIEPFEATTGAHVGPGALALFFFGDER